MCKLFDIWTGHGWEIEIDDTAMTMKKDADIVVLLHRMNVYYVSSDTIMTTELFKRTMSMLEKTYRWKKVEKEELGL